MTTLAKALGWNELIAWRLDPEQFAATWDSGEGAFRYGGRWNTPGIRAVYCSVDASTTILEVAVHKGFAALDRVAHRLTALRITDLDAVHVVEPASLPNPAWLCSGLPSAGQQEFGNALLAEYGCVLLPSVVSRHSWNLMFVASRASRHYELVSQERFALDTRLYPTAKP